MVSQPAFELEEPRDLSRVARVVLEIELRLMAQLAESEECDEPDRGLRPSLD
jgi:hypothetical protein